MYHCFLQLNNFKCHINQYKKKFTIFTNASGFVCNLKIRFHFQIYELVFESLDKKIYTFPFLFTPYLFFKNGFQNTYSIFFLDDILVFLPFRKFLDEKIFESIEKIIGTVQNCQCRHPKD